MNSNMEVNGRQLVFAPTFGNDIIKLVEMPDDVIAEIERNHEVYIKGEASEEAMLCTASRTFSMKFLESSNTILPFALDNTWSIGGCVDGHYELQPSSLNLAKIRKALAQSLIASTDEEPTTPGVPWDTINQLQASEEELRNALFKVNAVELEVSYWWLMAPELVTEVTDLLLTEARIREWSIDSLSASKCQEALSAYPRPIVYHCLYACSTALNSRSPDTFTIDRKKLCRFRAECLMRQQPEKQWVWGEFLVQWKDHVYRDIPSEENLNFTKELLEGLVYTHKMGEIDYIVYLPESSLPLDVHSRITLLFQKKKQWPLNELVPYLRDVIDSSTTPEKTLQKYAKADVHKVYTLR